MKHNSNLYQDCWPPSFADGPTINIEPTIPLTNDEKVAIIKEEVTFFRKIEFDQADTVTRKREMTQIRQEIMKLVDEFTTLSLKKNGKLFGKNFHHSTVIHAKKTIGNLAETDKKFRMQHELIRAKIASRL